MLPKSYDSTTSFQEINRLLCHSFLTLYRGDISLPGDFSERLEVLLNHQNHIMIMYVPIIPSKNIIGKERT